MPITTLTEVKLFLKISGSAQDSTIQALIPEVQERASQICSNDFASRKLKISSALIVFNTGARTLTANQSFAEAGFAAGDDVLITGSYRNDGYKIVEVVSGQVLTLATSETVVEEISGASIDVAVVQFPRGIKPIVAAMIRYDMDERPDRMGEKSESIGDYSATFDEAHHGYPRGIVNGLLNAAGRALGGFV